MESQECAGAFVRTASLISTIATLVQSDRTLRTGVVGQFDGDAAAPAFIQVWIRYRSSKRLPSGYETGVA